MKEDTGQILIVDKIVNNNIVIAKDFRGREVVAIGKGVGFRKRKNEAVHRSEIMKTYVLLDKVDSGVLTLFEEIQFEVIETSQKIIDYAQEKLNVKFNVNLLMSLSRINICPLIKELHFSDQNRNNKSKGNSQSNKYKLSYRRAVRRRIICGQSRDHDHPDSDQHTHIIYNKP